MVAKKFQKLVEVGECLLEAQAFERTCAALYRSNPTGHLRDAWLGSQQVVRELTEAYSFATEDLREACPANRPNAVPVAVRVAGQ